MAKPTGFLEIERADRGYLKPAARKKTWTEFTERMAPGDVSRQATRCMDCGVPFCHNGCPVNNMIPDWNNLVQDDDWKAALETLHSTNNFPEFTGRVCPAPCEASCTLNIDDAPVTIKTIECEIVDRGWDEDWITPQTALRGTGKRVAIVGSGPAGLACAQQLARAGHAPTVFEKADRIGGLLRYGIPDFKLEKNQIDRRIRQMELEGVSFRTGIEVGVTISLQRLLDEYEMLVLSGGAEAPRDLPIEGRDLAGVHFAMDFLTQQNKRVAGDSPKAAAPKGAISAKGRNVVVIGGGDTGSDCVGTSIRQGALSVMNFEIMPRPPEKEDKALTWPDWPLKLRTSSSHQEGCDRDWAVVTKRIVGDGVRVTGIECVRVDWRKGADGRMAMHEIEGSTFTIPCDLVLLAMGFTGARKEGLLEQAGVAMDPRGNVEANVLDYRTSRTNVFACGDIRRGQSLVVWAIREGRQCARAVDEALMGVSELPR